MQIVTVRWAADDHRAILRATPISIEGRGSTQKEAIGDLVLQLASANDASQATTAIDVSVEAV